MNEDFIYDKKTGNVPKMVHRVIREQNYDKASELLGKLFDATSDVSDQIRSYIRTNGVSRFFDNLSDYDFSPDVVEKLQAVRDVLYGLDREMLLVGDGSVKNTDRIGGLGDEE